MTTEATHESATVQLAPTEARSDRSGSARAALRRLDAMRGEPQDRAAVWLLLWALTFALSSAVSGTEPTGVLVSGLVGAVFGLILGRNGEKLRRTSGATGARRTISFWAAYWAFCAAVVPIVIWVAISSGPVLKALLAGQLLPDVSTGGTHDIVRFVLLLTGAQAILGAVIGAIGGAYQSYRIRTEVRIRNHGLSLSVHIRPADNNELD
jgi:hypothetical protein